MKISIVGPFSPFRGGIAKFNEQLSVALQKDHNLQFINFKNQYPAILFPGTNQYHESAEEKFSSIRILTPYNPFSFNHTYKKIREFCPDLIIFPYWIPFFIPAYLFLTTKIRKHSRIIILVHNFHAHEKWLGLNYLRKYFFHLADGFITLSDHVYHQMKEIYNDKLMIKGFHPVYSYFKKSEINIKETKKKIDILGKKVLLFFGYIKPYKGVLELLSAFSILADKEQYHLIIVGEVYGNDLVYHDKIKKLNLDKSITFINRYVSDNEMNMFFQISDALVLPYQQATQSGVMQLAIMYDLGMIVTPVGALPELVKKYSLGFVANSTKDIDIAKSIQKYFEMDQKKIREGCSLVKATLSWESLAEKIVAEIKNG